MTITLQLDSLGSLEEKLHLEVKKRSSFFQNKLTRLKQRAEDQQDWLGWVKLGKERELFEQIESFAQKKVALKKFDNLVIAGIGGSALGSQAIMQALLSPVWNELSSAQRNNYLKYYFIDNVDPDWNNEIFSVLDLERTLFCVISKSGGTAETASAFLWVLEKLKALKPESWQENLILITDPQKGPLRNFAEQNQVQSFPIPNNIGGRFSVFSSVGLVPLALTGIKIGDFQDSLEKAAIKHFQLEENIPVYLALALYLSAENENKKINPLMIYSSALSKIADWYVQLVAESLGKSEKVGITPLKFIGATDQHSQLQLISDGPRDKFPIFVFVEQFKDKLKLPEKEIAGFERLAGISFYDLIRAEGQATKKALLQEKIPSLSLTLDRISESSLAELIYIFELTTALLGELFEVNAFDQPGVELAKKYTYALLSGAKN